MAGGAREHFANGISVQGRLVWPAGRIPNSIEVDLEDDDGNIINSTKSGPSNQFRFDRVAVVHPVTCAFKTYHIVIHEYGLDPVRQQLSLSTSNFIGADIKVQLRPLPGSLSKDSEAVVSVEGMRQWNNDHMPASFEKAMTEARNGNVKKAISELEKAVKSAPNSYEANVELGIRYEQDGRYDDSAKMLNRALELNPASMKARAALGKRAYDTGDFQKAQEMLSEAVQLGNISADVYLMLGVSYFKVNRFELAEASLGRALDIFPGLGLANLALHNVYLKTKQLERALHQLDTYVQKHPNAPDREHVQAAAEKLRRALQQ